MVDVSISVGFQEQGAWFVMVVLTARGMLVRVADCFVVYLKCELR